MNKRDLVLSLLDKGTKQEVIPAAFFLHFDDVYHQGQAAIDMHLEFFRYTDMDFVKIQYENVFPTRSEIQKPADWEKMPLYNKDFYADQLNIVDGLVKSAQKEALIIMTLYSPFMCAGHTSDLQIIQHIKEDPAKAKRGIEIITESLMIFVKECIKLGVDGFYHSTQGGESHTFDDSALFKECIKPYDLILMEEINRSCDFNILHICDYHHGYDDLTPFLDYPGHIVNCSLELGTGKLTAREVSRMFDRPFMGGLDRLGTIFSGSRHEIKKAVEVACSQKSAKFLLGADCTVPSDINWENLRTAIAAAHGFEAA
jgi:uroporphyrinogen decarboxylase